MACSERAVLMAETRCASGWDCGKPESILGMSRVSSGPRKERAQCKARGCMAQQSGKGPRSQRLLKPHPPLFY
ncbi:hypothetical protein LEMLEM_LOCUS21799 [Lemmus lemmus]